ncbi:MAG: alpha-galactosidase [Mollicutes bacterium]|nr:alpha-galactosidase [Mollicutes bacterium]
MNIKFDNINKVFILENKNIIYSFYVNEIGVLVKLYFGEKIHDLTKNAINYMNDISGDVYSYYDLDNKKEHEFFNPYFSGQGSLIEIPSYLTYDKRKPLIVINHDDNSLITDFRYVSHEIFKGKTKFENMPYIKGNENECITLKITLKDLKDEIYLDAYYTIYEDLDLIVRHNEIINKSNKAIYINKASSLALDLNNDDYKLISIQGTYATDRELEAQDIKHNTILIEEISGAKGFYHNPVFMLKHKDSNDDFGEVIGGGLIYSGNFKFEFSGTNMDQTRCILGINDDYFEAKLDKFDTFITPEAFLIYSSKGTNYITHTFHDFIRKHVLRYVDGFENTILLNSWEACFMDFDTNKIKNFITQAKKMDVNLVVLDDGWFSNRNNDKSSLGDWWVNENKINLKEVIDYAHSLNIKFGLWIEPEQISFDSELYRKHPEFALFDKSINPTTLRHQFVLDLTNKEARDYVFDSICKIFDNYDIDYCKWDFNRLLTETYSMTLQKDKEREIFHLFTLGTYDLLNRFNKRYPHILLETCAGGGGRFDIGMLFYSHQIWASDETDAISRSQIQYSTNLFYPLECIGSHVSARKYLSIKEKAAVAMFGTFGYELDPTKLNDEDLKEVHIANERFLNNKHTIDKGDYYPLINPYESNFVCWELIEKDASKAIIYFMNYRHINWKSRFIKLKGLNKDYKYKNSFNNEIYYGDFYMNIGLNLSMGMTNFTPQLIELIKIDE